jgi:hypothetical protein
MKMRESRKGLSALLVGLGVATATLAGELPITVSPGDSAAPTWSDDACPTFSWARVEDAGGYEIVVYEVGRDESLRRRLGRSIPAGGGSWTPAVCLEPDTIYAWAVGARVEGSDEPRWSEPAFFAVRRGARVSVERAIQRALRRVEPQTGGGVPEMRASSPPSSPDNGALRSPLPTPAEPPLGSSAAITAELPATSGATIGVVGLTHSNDFQAAGVFGAAAQISASGVVGANQDQSQLCAIDPHGIGVTGSSLHSDGVGVVGFGFGASSTGVRGSGESRGVFGGATGTGGIGVFGSAGEGGIGVRGTNDGASSYAAFFSGSQGDLIGADSGGDLASPDFLVDAGGNVTATSFSMSSFTFSTYSQSAVGQILNSPSCGADEVMTGGGCQCAGGGSVQQSHPEGAAWHCQCSVVGVEAYIVCLASP